MGAVSRSWTIDTSGRKVTKDMYRNWTDAIRGRRQTKDSLYGSRHRRFRGSQIITDGSGLINYRFGGYCQKGAISRSWRGATSGRGLTIGGLYRGCAKHHSWRIYRRAGRPLTRDRMTRRHRDRTGGSGLIQDVHGSKWLVVAQHEYGWKSLVAISRSCTVAISGSGLTIGGL